MFGYKKLSALEDFIRQNLDTWTDTQTSDSNIPHLNFIGGGGRGGIMYIHQNSTVFPANQAAEKHLQRMAYSETAASNITVIHGQHEL